VLFLAFLSFLAPVRVALDVNEFGVRDQAVNDGNDTVLLLVYVDEQVIDDTSYGEVRQQAFAIMPKDTLQITGQRLCEKPLNKMELRWQVVEQLSAHCRKHLRPLYCTLDFASTVPDNPWLAALSAVH